MDPSAISPWPGAQFLGGMIPSPGTFHVAAYFASLAAVTNNDTAALSDGILAIQNNHFLPQTDSDIVFAYASGVTMVRARLNSPSIRQINPAYIRPVNQALLPANNPNVMMLQPKQLKVRGLEELMLELTETAAGPNNCYGVVGIRANYLPTPQGDIFNFRATGTTTVVASAWTQCALTFETLPPVGVYAVVGCEAISVTGVAFRLTFDGQFYRPGFLAQAVNGNRIPYDAYYGKFGVWGYFRTTNLPRLEMLCNAADTAQEIYLQCVRVA